MSSGNRLIKNDELAEGRDAWDPFADWVVTEASILLGTSSFKISSWLSCNGM